MLRALYATKYITPLREEGSLPAIVEADDRNLYVLKFRGAGQGPLALIAELVAGQIGRALGLNTPELALIEIDDLFGRNEPDPEIRDLLRASVGVNLAVQYFPGATMFDPASGDVADMEVASRAVWFDAFVMNVDRTARNANLLRWQSNLYFIDHGAAVYWQHNWETAEKVTGSAFPSIRDHLLLRWAGKLEDADSLAHMQLDPELFARIVDQVPDAWLLADSESVGTRRDRYVDLLSVRLQASSKFLEEAVRAHAELV